MRRETGAEAVNLLGICEGGVLTLAYAALEPARVKNLVLTVTPLDFHADQKEEKLEHGFINVWTRSLTAQDVDRMIEVWGVLPGEFMGAVFSMLTPIRSITKYNLDLLEVVDDEAKLLNYLRMEKWLADRPHHAGEAAKQWLKDLYQENKLIKASSSSAGARSTYTRSPAGAQHLRPGRPHHPAADRRGCWAASSAPRTTPSSACRAGISACSSPASRRASSARASSTGWPSATKGGRQAEGRGQCATRS